MSDPKVSLPRNWFIALLVGVCVLSAGIGSGLALLAQEGPAGERGARGPAGPQGPRGPEGASAEEELGGLEGEVEELRGRVEEAEGLEERVDELESQLSDLEGGLLEGGLDADILCEEFGIC